MLVHAKIAKIIDSMYCQLKKKSLGQNNFSKSFVTVWTSFIVEKRQFTPAWPKLLVERNIDFFNNNIGDLNIINRQLWMLRKGQDIMFNKKP